MIIILPIPGNQLQSKFTDPYVVIQKLSDHNYVTAIPDRHRNIQMVHINLIKPYIERQSKEVSNNIVMFSFKKTYQSEDELNNCENVTETEMEIPAHHNPKNSQILSNLDSYFAHLPFYSD